MRRPDTENAHGVRWRQAHSIRDRLAEVRRQIPVLLPSAGCRDWVQRRLAGRAQHERVPGPPVGLPGEALLDRRHPGAAQEVAARRCTHTARADGDDLATLVETDLRGGLFLCL